jgi:DNA mismatch repair ATPase MutS
MLLLIRDGVYYQAYDDDAETLAKVLRATSLLDPLVIDTRAEWWPKGMRCKTEFHHQYLEKRLRELLKAGHRVAICDQVETPAPRGAEVNRIVAPRPDRRVVSPNGRVQGQPNALAFIGRDGTLKQTPWMFD